MVQEDEMPIIWQTRKLIIIVSENVQIEIEKMIIQILLYLETCAFKHIQGFCDNAEQTEWKPAERQNILETRIFI